MIESLLQNGEKFVPNAIATDNIDGDITDEIQVSGINTNITGEYEVTYKSQDKSGNESQVIQKVIVKEELSNGLPVLMYHFFFDNIDYWL